MLTRSRRAFFWSSSLATLSIVVAFMYPTLHRFMELQLRSQCASNLRQLWIATAEYVADHDDRFPAAHLVGTDYYWWGLVVKDHSVDLREGPLAKYLQSEKFLQCPEFDILNERKDAPRIGYAYNYRTVGGNYSLSRDEPENEATAMPARIRDIKEPIRTVLFADSARWNYFTPDKKPFLEENTYLQPPYRKHPTFHARHSGNGHVIYVDGHVWFGPPLEGERDNKVKGAPRELGYLPLLWFRRD